ncbi:MAG: hypothetical protein KDB53_14695 [Planctomycetes bacterium]|nr:hypothetical protein [Planctomycetota bacterium]
MASATAMFGAGLGMFAQRAPRPRPPIDVATVIAQDYRSLDLINLHEGYDGIINQLALDLPQTTMAVFDWIQARGHSELNYALVSGLSDLNVEIRRRALGNLRKLPPVSLREFLSPLHAAKMAEEDDGQQALLAELIVWVENS